MLGCGIYFFVKYNGSSGIIDQALKDKPKTDKTQNDDRDLHARLSTMLREVRDNSKMVTQDLTKPAHWWCHLSKFLRQKTSERRGKSQRTSNANLNVLNRPEHKTSKKLVSAFWPNMVEGFHGWKNRTKVSP